MTEGRIRILSAALINRIAAGEIIERPASVVKELLENALDAQARRIEARFDQGGLVRILVADDGQGMVREDLRLAIEPHATSKIKTAEDLDAILTLGFRGEALASIAAVSHMEIYSRFEGEPIGHLLRVQGSSEPEVSARGGPFGTRVEARNLFFNAPVRLEQMRRASTEALHITAIVQEVALANPSVALHLYRDDRLVFHTSGSADLGKCLVEVFGVEVFDQLIPFGSPARGIWGYLGAPSLERSRRDRQYFMLGGRVIRHVGLQLTLERAFSGFLSASRYPFAVVQLELRPDQVDVNVHPTKREVRIHREVELKSLLYHEVQRALLGMPVPHWDVTKPSPALSWTNGEPKPSHVPSASGAVQETQVGWFPRRRSSSSVSDGDLSQLQPLGQVGSAYIVARGPDGLYLIDQHAAHERVYFDSLLRAYREGQIASQRTLTPVLHELAPDEADSWSQFKGYLEEMGFEMEEFDGHSLLIRAVPIIAGEPFSPHRLGELFHYLQGHSQSNNPEGVAVAIAACRASVKAGDALSLVAIEQLLNALSETPEPMTCPHGRPTIVHVTMDDLARLFQRK